MCRVIKNAKKWFYSIKNIVLQYKQVVMDKNKVLQCTLPHQNSF